MVEIKCKYEKLVPLGKLKPHPKNPHIHSPEQIDRLAKLIQYQGVRHPIIISKRSGLIVAGHGRLEALKRLKIKEAPVDVQKFENQAQEYAFIVSDNAIGKDEWAALNNEDISAYVKDFEDFDIGLLGIKDFNIEMPFEGGQTDEDAVPEVAESFVKTGELWQLGNHRLLCGDSTKIEDVERLMGGEKADMVFTDPPYGISYENTKGAIMGDGSLDVFEKACGLIKDFSKESSHVYIFFGIQLACESLAILNKNFKQYNILVMPITHQNKPGPPGYFNSNYEVCYFTQIGQPKKHIRGQGSVSESTMNDSRYEGDGKLERYRALGDQIITEHNLKTVHPTEKKVSGIEFYIKISSLPNNVILDLFGGSGSTMIASEKINRSSRIMELDPHYCSVIINRWQDFTGKEAVKIG